MPPNAEAVNCTVTLTRRAAVVRGSRFAYAAPVVLASFRLSELEARAEEAVSQTDVQAAAAGLFPPVIESVSYAAPSWVVITGRNLSDASVTFVTDQGVVTGEVIQLNTDTRIIVSIGDGLTITSTNVVTPEGAAIFDQQAAPALARTERRREDREQDPQALPANEDQSSVADVGASEASAAPESHSEAEAEAEPDQVSETSEVDAESSIDDPVDEPVDTAPAESAQVEQPVEAQAPEPVPTEPPVQEPAPPEPAPPVEEAAPPPGPTDYAIGVEVIVGAGGAAMYDAPSASGNLVVELRAGSRMVIVGPLQQGDDGRWWQVQDYESGMVGFVEEWRLIVRP